MIINKSLILSWNEFNTQSSPEANGVYVMRESPTLEGIIYIGSSNNLRERLLTHWRENDISSVKFFDWYQTKTDEEAKQLERLWITKYKPRFNTQYL